MQMHPVTALSTLALLLSAFCYLFRRPHIKRNGESLRYPPNTLPLLGNGILFLRARHELFSWFAKCEQKFGFETFQIFVPSLPPGVVINDPKILEHVFKDERVFAKGEFFKQRSWDLFGNGIINVDGAMWKMQRKAGLHFLSNSNMKVLSDTTLPQYLNGIIQSLSITQKPSYVDLQEIFLELTTQIMGWMAYDMDIRSSDPFSQAFDYASGATGKRFQNPFWRISEIFAGKHFRDSVLVVKRFGSLIVSNAAKIRRETAQPFYAASSESLNSTSGTLISSLLDKIGNEQIVADAALNYLSAGRDTTAQALTWTFYLLMRHSHVVDAIRSEVSNLKLDSEKRKVASSDPIGARSDNDQCLKINTSVFHPASLPYVTAVFYETLRLYPPVPFELKQCQEATTLPDGTFLPRMSILVWCNWAMNRSKLIWGDDADHFKPDRWLENGRFLARPAFEYPVFHGGVRSCLGKRMAELIAVQAIATLSMLFDFEAVDDEERTSRDSLTLPMEGGLPCYVMRRRHAI